MVRNKSSRSLNKRKHSRVLKVKPLKFGVAGHELLGMPICEDIVIIAVNESRRPRVVERIELYSGSRLNKLIMTYTPRVRIEPGEEKTIRLRYSDNLRNYIVNYDKIKVKIYDDRDVCSQKTISISSDTKDFVRYCASM